MDLLYPVSLLEILTGNLLVALGSVVTAVAIALTAARDVIESARR